MPTTEEATFTTVLVTDREYFRGMLVRELHEASIILENSLRGIGDSTKSKEITGYTRENVDRGIQWLNECRDLLSQIGYSEREARKMEKEAR
jgi:hypothetical protein